MLEVAQTLLDGDGLVSRHFWTREVSIAEMPLGKPLDKLANYWHISSLLVSTGMHCNQFLQRCTAHTLSHCVLVNSWSPLVSIID